MSSINFSCTKCGKCCQGHSLPLTLDEAIGWLEDQGNVAIFCEAIPWASDPGPEDLRAEHQERRSFQVQCGSSQARVIAILVAVISGACKNLGADAMCQIYERRPLVCRIYPAEISPFIQLDIARKVCPPEAWVSNDILSKDGRIIDSQLQLLIDASRQTDYDEAIRKGQLCSELGIETAAVADEGFVAHEPERGKLLAALKLVRDSDSVTVRETKPWRLFSRAAETVRDLHTRGLMAFSEKTEQDSFMYLHAPTRQFKGESELCSRGGTAGAVRP